MAETVGSLIDKLTIVELKRYHVQEYVDREAARDRRSPEPTHETMARWSTLWAQRNALAAELDALIHNPPKPFRQLKMYNDPRFQPSPRR